MTRVAKSPAIPLPNTTARFAMVLCVMFVSPLSKGKPTSCSSRPGLGRDTLLRAIDILRSEGLVFTVPRRGTCVSRDAKQRTLTKLTRYRGAKREANGIRFRPTPADCGAEYLQARRT